MIAKRNPGSRSRWVWGTGLLALGAVALTALVLVGPALDEWRWRSFLSAPGGEKDRAFDSLVGGGSERTIGFLIRALRKELHASREPIPDDRDLERCKALGGPPAECLALVGPRAIPALLKVVEKDADRGMRIACREAICCMECRPSWGGAPKWTERDLTSPLIEALSRNPPARTREALFHVLARPGVHVEAVLTVASFLEHPDPEAQEHAAWVLASMGPSARQAAPAIEKLLGRRPTEEVRSMATRARDSLEGILDCRDGLRPEFQFGEELLLAAKATPGVPGKFFRKERKVCLLHGDALQEEVVLIFYGLFGKRPGEIQARLTRFPEAFEEIDSACSQLPWQRARVLFCMNCRRELDEYDISVASGGRASP